MKGTNELKLSQAAICEAIEYWLTNTVLNKDNPAPKVEKVEAEGKNSYAVDASFVVTLSEAKTA